MLIGSRFHRPKAPIDLGGQVYFFTPRDPQNPDSEHVCEVSDPEHIQRLLGIPEGYYIAPDQPAKTTATRPQTTPPPPSATSPATGGESTPPSADAASTATDATTTPPVADPPATTQVALPEELQEAAANLVALSWQALSGQVKKGGIPKAVLVEALRLEQAKPEDDRRSAAIKILNHGIEAAG